MTTPSNNNSSSPQRATATRDAIPLPDAARRVIRNQRGGDMHSTRGVQILQRDTLPSSRSARRVLTPQMQQAHGSLGSSQRMPTLQEMYNTWRSLEEQISQMRRLPMFVKAELKFCHGCRILKIRCTCFDYSQLEAAYQEKDRILRYTALREFPIEGSESEEDVTTETVSPSTGSVTATPSNTLTGPSATPSTFQDLPLVNNLEFVPAETYAVNLHMGAQLNHPVADTNFTADTVTYGTETVQDVEASDFDFNTALTTSTIGPTSQNNAMTLLSPSSAGHRQSTTVPASAGATALTHTPTLVKFELRTIIMAKEKIGTQSRRWQCQYGLSDNPEDPICKREDDNMDTIRRHYGREHGSHRFHKKPILRIRCSHCDITYDKQRPPSKCPGCKVDHGIWLREIFAIIEVPVPLNSQEETNGGAGPGHSGGVSSSFGGFGASRGFGVSGIPGAEGASGLHGAGGFGNAHGPGTAGSPGGFHSAAGPSVVQACRRQVDSTEAKTIPYDPATGMPECYNDIRNNTTAVPVMPLPGAVAHPSDSPVQRPSSSSSLSTAQSQAQSLSRSLSQAQSPFTQGFYAVGRGLPLSPATHVAYAITTPSMSPGTPMSATSPASNASSAYDAETAAMFPREFQGMAVTDGQGQVDFATLPMVNSDAAFGGPVGGVAGEGGGVHSRATDSPTVVGHHDTPGIGAGSDQDSESAQPPAPSGTVRMVDVQMFMDMAAAQVAPAVSPAQNDALSNNNGPWKGKCTTESEFFYFAD
ncbi:uncharacterized protein SPSK_05982 [Sporothrix schenckii 1099-18]|uniref:Uncharacterized protein n=1 Tax=Sporothrix schenckii 1099-18 TaxID=1397361 RepID=A0A0F2MND5_SPOSC|nr:uncharacterized protein SPSK_05982 [Sporothrix schenckii 1099-18]KJR89691.1 hypothetical protein SPSK_05982 [Sporothrix schenckii 1099-18]